MDGFAGWWRRLAARPLAGDLVLVAVLFGAGIVSSRITVDLNAFSVPGYAGPSAAAITATAAATAGPLLVRRRLPELAALGTAAGFLWGRAVLDVPEASVASIAIAVALYSGAAHGGRSRHAADAVALTAVMARLWWEVTVGLPPIDNVVLARVFLLVLNVALFAGAWALGDALRRRRRDAEELRRRARQLEAEREERARRAVFDERVRIARELHDVVAHHVSVMGIQAGAARRVLEREPARAAEALSSIEASSREAVTELNRLLGFLRREGEVDDRAPQPSLADLPSLVDRTAGVEVSVEVQGEARPLPATVELSAYRIVQEALTNVRKHAGATSAEVLVRYGPSALEVRVVDDGRGGDGAPGGGGHGLIGMRERVQLHGGRLAAGPRPGGGFGVHATIPLDGDRP